MRWSHDAAGPLRKGALWHEPAGDQHAGISIVVFELNDLIFMFVVAACGVAAMLLAVGLWYHCRRHRKD
jgi:hypothetical protein